ncbi:MAG TPA: CCA tRNA nucleotidyltransferase [Clostridiales bacterium]|nr:CCA tRNA nucleotidyltransferase [Clostridiales bacterium]HQP70714.1 CCA tRNA nucleotidyltransferase [Clostridiales bacterium]
MKVEIDRDILKAVQIAEEETGSKCYLVGGFIRNRLLGYESEDIDFVIEGDSLLFAEKTAEILGRKRIIKFPRFKTAKIVYKKKAIEFVSARSEKYKSDSRKPDVRSASLFCDLSRRDFTINALALSVRHTDTSDLIDFFNGKQDLVKKILRTPLEPKITYSEDPLRMLRCIRFSSVLGFKIDPLSFSAISENKERIHIVSVERISDEFFKILGSKNPVKGVYFLFRSGLLKEIFPELTDLCGIEEKDGIRHKDTFIHTLKVLFNISKVSNDIKLRLAALMHDIGKSKTKYFRPDQGWTFHGHDDKGSEMFFNIADRMKWSNDIREYVSKIILLHHRPISLAKEEVTDSGVRRLLFEGGCLVDDLMLLCRADITTANKNKLNKYLENFDNLSKKIVQVEEKDKLRNFKPPLGGDDIMKLFGIKEGPEIGRIKKQIVDAILSGEIDNDKDSAMEMLSKIIMEEKVQK